MLRYSMARLGRKQGRAKGSTVHLQRIAPRLSYERDYYSALRTMLAGIAQNVKERIIPAYEAEQAWRNAEQAVFIDADKSWFAELRDLTAILQRVADETVERIIGLEAKRHTDSFVAEAKRAIGVDISAIVREEDLGEHLRNAVGKNASLIKGLADDTLKRIEQAVYDNSTAGNSAATLRKQLREEFGVADKRARLIARDQMGKINADLTELRQRQAGIDEYDWGTSHDERVRTRHRDLDGRRFKWDEPTGAEQGLPPGKPIQCRCWARGIVVF